MDTNITFRPGKNSVDVSGKLSFDNSTTFLEIIKKAAETDNETVVVNLNDCSFIDSAGMGLLMQAHAYCISNDRKYKVIGAHDHVKKMLEIAHMNEIMDIDDTQDDDPLRF